MTNEEQEYFSQLVYSHSGISLGHDKTYLFENRLSELAKTIGCPTVTDLYRRAKFNMTHDLIDRIVDAMTTNETLFFRDSAPFEALKNNIVPDLVKRKNNIRNIRIWSAACSSGQEIYSISMMFNEIFPDIVANWRVELLASDISTQMLNKAKIGKFSQIEVNRGLPITYLIKYFKQHGSEWIIDERLKKIVEFKKLNLKDDIVGIGPFDIIFCRYVLIYFDLVIKQKIFKQFIKLLTPEGILFLGSSETIYGITDDFVKVEDGKAIYYKVKKY